MAAPAPRRQHPYSALPDHAFWNKAVGGVPPFAVDPVVEAPFQIGPDDAIATAGSCFAQHISHGLKSRGFRYLVTETAPASLAPSEQTSRNYGVFSARYGNLYTARQLLQLFDRAYGKFKPRLSYWQSGPEYVDPFRPRIQPGGFRSQEALEADRESHFAAVRRLFEEVDVFVFTLGLTEAWEYAADGATLPLAPGVAGGHWDPAGYAFRNYSYQEVLDDLLGFVDRLQSVNSAVRVLLTVSPVPLLATYEPRHVLVSTCLSKSALRLAAAACCEQRPGVAYFPSFEIITGPHAGGNYFETDLRSVNDAGVQHVMRVFFEHYCRESSGAAQSGPTGFDRELEELRGIVCDEEAINAAGPVAKNGFARAGRERTVPIWRRFFR